MQRIVLNLLAASLIATAGSTAANAAIVIGGAADEGKSYDVTFVGQVSGKTVTGISNTLELKFKDLSANNLTYTFDYEVTNTSTIDSRLRSFGFDVIGGVVTSASSTGSFGFASRNSNYPEGVGKLDACFAATSNGGCTGGPGGLTRNQTGTGTLTFTLAAPTNSLTINNITTRFQSINGSGFNGASGVGIQSVTPAIPEPSTWLMMILGFAAVGGMMRRRTDQGVRVRFA